MTSCSACSEERPNSFFLDSFSCSSSHSFCNVRLVMTWACSCSRVASFASSLACSASSLMRSASSLTRVDSICAFSCWSCSYSAREMVTISRAACLIFSVSHEKIILQNSEKSQCFQWVSGNFPVQTAVNPVTGRWAFGCSICSPSMSQRYCCGVSVFTSDSERGH